MSAETEQPWNADPLAEPAAQTISPKESEAWTPASSRKAPPGVLGCNFCANTKFRRSRVRLPDLAELLMLRYPLRCTRCNQRQYGFFVTAAYALPPKQYDKRIDRGRDTWQAWTESEGDQVTPKRPMTTSIGPRATKLHPPSSRTPRRRTQEREKFSGDDRQIW